jgi:hypothetical protein
VTSTDADRVVQASVPAPPGLPRGRRLAITAALIVTVAVAGVLLANALTSDGGSHFEVRDQQTGEVYYSRPIEIDETFELEHTHSVTRRLVVETFSALDGETVAIEEMRFDQNGPNLPTGPEPLGDGETTFIYEDDGSYRVIHHSFPLGTVPLLIGSESVDHTLTFADGDRLRLLDIAERGTAVELIVRPG